MHISKGTFRLGSLLAALLIPVALAPAAMIVYGDTSDVEKLRDGPFDNDTAASLVAGRADFGGSKGYRSAFFVFDLSGVTGEIETAELGLYLQAILPNTTNYNADLYGIGYASSTSRSTWPATVTNLEATSDPAEGVVKLATNFATPSSTVGSYLTVSGTTLVNFLNNRTEDVVLFRVNKQTDAGNRNTGYRFTSADSTVSAELPKLTLAVVPEPAVSGLAITAGLFLIRRRRAVETFPH